MAQSKSITKQLDELFTQQLNNIDAKVENQKIMNPLYNPEQFIQENTLSYPIPNVIPIELVTEYHETTATDLLISSISSQQVSLQMEALSIWYNGHGNGSSRSGQLLTDKNVFPMKNKYFGLFSRIFKKQ